MTHESDGQTMRAAQLVEPRRIQVITVARPQPGPGQVRLRIEGCGVCGSNLPVWRGLHGLQYPLEPGAPGHEAWGAVDTLGSHVRGVARGERYAFLSFRSFAEFDIADAATLVALPPAVGVFPGEALGCALNIFRRSQIRSEHTVALVGVGFIGGLLVRLAARAGARVIALSRRDFARRLAHRLGAVASLDITDSAAIPFVMEFTGGHGCERVIEAIGSQTSLDLASALVGSGGRLIIAGYHQDGPRRVDMQSWNWRGIDVINAHERKPQHYVAGMRAAAAEVACGALDPSPLYTHSFELEQCAAAFDALEARPPGFIKGWIRPHKRRKAWIS